MEAAIGAVVSVGLEALLRKLNSSDILKFASKKHVEGELEKWKNELTEIRELLDDAEEKQITKPLVKKWLADLRDLAFDMEDVLDDFSYHYQAFPSKLKAELADIGDHEGKGTTSKARRFINTAYSTCTLLSTAKIKKITARLQGIYARKTGLGLEKVAAYITQSTLKERPLTTSSLAYEPCVYGRDAEKQTLINMLLSGRDANEASSSSKTETKIKNFSVVSIVGLGGMGKTTLARLVYDHVKTRQVYNHVEARLVYDGDEITTKHFNLKAWARVSVQFDAERITKIILNDLTSGSNDSLSLDQSQSKLKEILKGKRFLLVLDDVWTEDHKDWSCLQAPFLWGSPGSKVIVTTRSERVARMMRMEGDKNNNSLELQCLSHDDCWSVFKEHAFRNIANAEVPPNLALIRNKIVEKCGGLPLAAKALGALLGDDPTKERWNGLLDSKIWESPVGKSDILPVLRLSYNHLSPPAVKKCFSYCAIFPKDYEFDKEELIRMWMAECLIIPRDEIQMEDIGNDYFEQLLSRLFFHPSRTNPSLFVMHHLLHDLAKFVSGEICFSLESNPRQQSISDKVRYSSFIRGKHDAFKKFEAFSQMKYLRAFIALPTEALWYDYYISSKVLEELVPKLRRLRVLLLSGYKISEIPDSFGHDLKLLRYLHLSATKIKRLPDSIGKLYHLETLILSKCRSLTRLPCSIGKLNNLRYLDVTDTSLEEMPPQTNRLRSLQVLSNFIVGKEDGLSLNVKELKNLPHLRGRLWISKLENVVSVQHAREASLNMKHELEELRMEWSYSDGSQINKKNQLDVLESLQPHSNLRKLSICGYGGSKFPRWIRGTVSFSEMVAIDMVNCRSCTSLSCLGRLPMLQHLQMEGMNEIRTIGAEFYGRVDKPFPSLKSLSFRNMFKWEVWKHPSSSLSEPYPHLLHLTMEDCPSLMEKLPTYLPSLQHLSISGCPQLGVSLAGLIPSLSRLQVQRCTGQVLRSEITIPSLTDLMINRISELTRLHEGLLPGLQRLQIYKCYELTRLWEERFESEEEEKQENIPSKLESLTIVSCNNLEKLPNGLHMLECLRELSIHSCPRLVSLSEFGFPPMLRRLVISNCYGLRCLPDMMMTMMRDISDSSSSSEDSDDDDDDVLCLLESLEIRECPSLICFPEGQLPNTLKRLIISECENLQSLPEGILMMQQSYYSNSISTHHLEDLEIRRCPSLHDFPGGAFTTTLKRLEISECAMLKSISEEMMMNSMFDKYCSLERLVFRGYPHLERLRLPDFFGVNLRELCIEECENLEFVPDQLQSLTALTSLIISHCQNMKTPLSQWGLPTLTSLKQLTLSGIFPEVASFSFSYDQNQNHLPLLPISLASLSITDFPNLKSLTSLALHSLTLLEMLQIERCPKLQSLGPTKGLPLTLSRLYINGCPLLQKRWCSNETPGRDWRNISHIPYVEIDHKCIFEQQY